MKYEITTEEVLCDVCGKNMTNQRTKSSYIGLAVRISLHDGDTEFLQKQMGGYKIGKSYNVCYECWLKSLGVKP